MGVAQTERLRYRRTASAAKISSIAFSVAHESPPTPGLSNNSRVAVTVADRGFHFGCGASRSTPRSTSTGFATLLDGIEAQLGTGSAAGGLHQGQDRGEAGPPSGQPGNQEDRQRDSKRSRSDADQCERRHADGGARSDEDRR